MQSGQSNVTGHEGIAHVEKKGKNGNKDVSRKIDEEKLIPMGEDRIKEHSEHFSDF